MAADRYPDLLTILVNLSTQIAPIIMMMQGVCALIGIYLIAGALVEIWGVTYDNAMKYVPSNQKFSIPSALMQLVVGAIFSMMSTLEWVGIMSRTITGDFVNSRYLSHAPADSSYAAQVAVATGAIMGVLQIVGFVAMCKGWMSVNRIFNGQSNNSLGMALWWVVGGILAWNFSWFAQVINNSTGFNFIQLFPAS